MHLHIPELVQRVLPAVRPGHSISEIEWSVLEKAAETFLEGSPLEIEPSKVVENAEVFFNEGASRRLWRIRLLFILVEMLPLAVYGRRFTQLTATERRKLAEEYLASDKRIWRLAGKIRILVYLGAYGDVEASKATGFVPIPLRARFRRKGSKSPNDEGTPRLRAIGRAS